MKSDDFEFRGQGKQVIVDSSGNTQQMTRPKGIPCTRTVPPRSLGTTASDNCYLLTFSAEIRFTILRLAIADSTVELRQIRREGSPIRVIDYLPPGCSRWTNAMRSTSRSLLLVCKTISHDVVNLFNMPEVVLCRGWKAALLVMVDASVRQTGL